MSRIKLALCELDSTGRSTLPGTDVSGLRVAGMTRASRAEVLFSSYRQKSHTKYTICCKDEQVFSSFNYSIYHYGNKSVKSLPNLTQQSKTVNHFLTFRGHSESIRHRNLIKVLFSPVMGINTKCNV